MLRKRHYIALGAVAVAGVVLLELPVPLALRLKTGVSSLYLPFFGLAASAPQLPKKAVDALLPRGVLLGNIDRLQRENQELQIHQQQDDAIARENDALRAAIGWAGQQPWKLKPARVILRDPANWWRMVQIDAGSADGIRNDCPVLTPQGLVGRVSLTSRYNSQVVLLGDPSCRVSVSVDDPARDIGVLAAGGPLDYSLLTLTYLPGGATLKPGDNVYTSGQGGIFPAGIPVGRIYDFHQADFGLYTEARVKPSANLGALNTVWVLIR
ncbi:MAG: rod shape-determining protein MreC [Verrucomicrobia bacterium]|nr:rod shape-determining protein MreC [Verrucomicrobiota bacterium]MDE3099053.1 rod shape-determining protein MreC [Verrucomicrobiota bacterium]